MSLKTDLVWYWDLSSADATITDQHSGLVLSRIGTTTTDSTGGPDGGPCISVGNAAGKYYNASVPKTVSYDDGFTANIWARSIAGSPVFNMLIMHRADPAAFILGGLYFQIAAIFAETDYGLVWNDALTQRLASAPRESHNVWQMLTLVDDGSIATLYRNGVAVGTSATVLGARGTANAPFAIGGHWANLINTQLNHRGQLAKAGVWNVPLTASQITRLYNKGRGRNYADLDAGGLATIIASHYAALGI